MCGIVGYHGRNDSLPVLIEGLSRLEYRGYDSAGVVVIDEGKAQCRKAVGKIKSLQESINNSSEKLSGKLGIAHTRWATHGKPNEVNAHPHSDCHGKIWVVHNGIIENYQHLKEYLIGKGHKFVSETDTEVISHLIEDYYEGDLLSATLQCLARLKGTYGLAVVSTEEPARMLAVKNGSPLLIGLGENETIVASDASAIISRTKQVVYLADGEVADISADGFKVLNFQNKEINKKIDEIEWDLEKVEKNGFSHFMAKEIFEQVNSVNDTIRGRLVIEEGRSKLGGLELIGDKLRYIDRAIIIACGTARNAGLIGEYMLEKYANLPTEVEFASEFRYREPMVDEKTLVIAISQSGETADTLAAVKEAKEKGAQVVGIVNVVGSTIARETSAGLYNHIGPEISVASTKAFTSQIVLLSLLALFLGRKRNLALNSGQRIAREINTLSEKIEKILEQDQTIKKIAEKYSWAENFAFLGRKYNFPIALEGALKLKELSYIHAEGYAAGELKHGPIALIDEKFPSIFIIPKDSVYEKNLSNLQEVRTRNGKVIVIATEGDEKVKELADDVIYVPSSIEMLYPVLTVVPLQLFAYHMAVIKGFDVDRPRNLAKSVTVE